MVYIKIPLIFTGTSSPTAADVTPHTTTPDIAPTSSHQQTTVATTVSTSRDLLNSQQHTGDNKELVLGGTLGGVLVVLVIIVATGLVVGGFTYHCTKANAYR